MDKINGYGIRQSVLGSSRKDIFYFATKDEQANYYNKHNYCDKLRVKKVIPELITTIEEIESFYKRGF